MLRVEDGGHDCAGRAPLARIDGAQGKRPVQVSIHASAWPFLQAQIIVSRFVPARTYPLLGPAHPPHLPPIIIPSLLAPPTTFRQRKPSLHGFELNRLVRGW